MAGDQAIHEYFGLTYSNYLVLPRTLLQSMPAEWQERFVGIVRELESAFEHIEHAPGYEVKAVNWREVWELSEAELKAAQVDVTGDEDNPEYWADSGQLERHDVVGVPCDDPIPHYNRGRERVEPRG